MPNFALISIRFAKIFSMQSNSGSFSFGFSVPLGTSLPVACFFAASSAAVDFAMMSDDFGPPTGREMPLLLAFAFAGTDLIN